MVSETETPERSGLTGPPEEAPERLRNGAWEEWVKEALDCLVAGEQSAKWILFYSDLSAHLPNKLHILIMGKS